MRMVFADTGYWVAVSKPGDKWKEPALEAKQALGDVILLTTDEVLNEFLTLLSKGGERLRHTAAEMVRAIRANVNIRVIPQSRQSFDDGLALYSQRPDKEYSLTDCISINTMRAHGVTEALTTDRHFEQEGFVRLIPEQPE
jgi:predicted nucleic acid-binding protein